MCNSMHNYAHGVAVAQKPPATTALDVIAIFTAHLLCSGPTDMLVKVGEITIPLGPTSTQYIRNTNPTQGC